MKKFWKNFKNSLGFIAAILVIVLISIPFVFLYTYLRKQNKTITIYPKISIKEIKNEDDVDTDALKGAIDAANQIMKKFRS